MDRIPEVLSLHGAKVHGSLRWLEAVKKENQKKGWGPKNSVNLPGHVEL